MSTQIEESRQRGETKLSRLLGLIEEKKLVLQQIISDEDQAISNLEISVETETHKTQEDESEYENTLETFRDIKTKIEIAEKELNDINNEIWKKQEYNERIDKLEQELCKLKEERKQKRKDFDAKVKFFFCPL